MIKKCVLIFLTILTTSLVSAQANLLNSTSVDQIGVKTKEQLTADNDGPVPYGYIDDRDVLWSKVIWEFIDLNQKINLPYYFPIDTLSVSPYRRSLWDTLIKGIKQGKIKGIYDDDFFTSPLTPKMIEDKIKETKTTVGADGKNYTDISYINSELVTGYMIKGMWYFDKRQGELKYRLLGLAPMGPDLKTIGNENVESDDLFPVFWVFFPTAREVLHSAKVFNPKNVSNSISYDHLLNARRFNAVIVKEENIYDNRAIDGYVRDNSLFKLLEANKIKEEIRNREMDMWNY